MLYFNFYYISNGGYFDNGNNGNSDVNNHI